MNKAIFYSKDYIFFQCYSCTRDVTHYRNMSLLVLLEISKRTATLSGAAALNRDNVAGLNNVNRKCISGNVHMGLYLRGSSDDFLPKIFEFSRYS